MSSSPSSSQKYRSPRQTGESTLNVVEEDIRKAEELLAKDVYRRGQEQKPPSEKHQQRDRQVRTQSSQRHGGRTRSSPITSGSHQQTQTSQSSASATVTVSLFHFSIRYACFVYIWLISNKSISARFFYE